MKSAFVSALVLWAAIEVPGFAQNSVGSPSSMQRAVTIAQKGLTDATFLYGRVESAAGGNAYWGLYFLCADGSIVEKEIDAATGAVLKSITISQVTPNTPDASSPPPANSGKVNPKVVTALQTRKQTKLPTVQYIDNAVQNKGGAANGYQLNLANNQLQVQVSGTGATSGGGNWSVTMDMATGRIVNP
jgi:uncharacterized membrane protein YkoI